MSNVFTDRKRKLEVLKDLRKNSLRNKEPAVICPNCSADIEKTVLEHDLNVCACGHHFYIPSEKRLKLIFDNSTYKVLFKNIIAKNPINFPRYETKLEDVSLASGLSEACVCAQGNIDSIPVICAALDSSFLMGSMGTAVGEKITLCAEYAQKKHYPLIIFSASGGARMQEGIFSLMQMAKTSAAIKNFADSGGLFISYLTDPTTGGVTASFASLGDIILAEPGALIGFAGPRVIEQTINATLPEGFQRSEFLLEHGFIDAIVHRKNMASTLRYLLKIHRRR